jgi:hypothetical protein
LEAAVAAAREAPPEEPVDAFLRDALQRGGVDRLTGARRPTHRRGATLARRSSRACPAPRALMPRITRLPQC